MGSSKLLDRFDNLLRVCAYLNYAMESDSAVAGEARDMGWKLGQWDSFDHPYFDRVAMTWYTLTYFDRVAMTWYTLTEAGEKIKADPPNYLI